MEHTKNGTRLTWPLEGWAKDFVKAKVETLSFPGSYIFHERGESGIRQKIKRSLPAAVRAAGLVYGRTTAEGVTFHTFRHSMASLALNAGIPGAVVQKLGN